MIRDDKKKNKGLTSDDICMVKGFRLKKVTVMQCEAVATLYPTFFTVILEGLRQIG